VEDADPGPIRPFRDPPPIDMTARHDADGLRPEHPLVSAMPVTRLRLAASTVYCDGRVHTERGQPAPLDMRAKRGPSRVALVEDGAAFCGSCALEVDRGSDDSR
jgi:hypothetical protein